MYPSRPIQALVYTPYDLTKNALHNDAPIITLQEFTDRPKISGNVIVKHNNIQEFVPHNDFYTSPKQKAELRAAVSARFGVVKERKRKSNNLKNVLKVLRKTGAGIICPTDAEKAPIVSFDEFKKILEFNNKRDFPAGVCVVSKDYYIPPMILDTTRPRKQKVIDAIHYDLNLPTLKRDRILTISHKYGSPKDNISHGKHSMIRQVAMKKRLVTSGRAVVSLVPRIDECVNINTIFIPRKMYENFFGKENVALINYCIMTRYPINALGHTQAYVTHPWDNYTIGVPPCSTAPQNMDFDGDTVLLTPLLDFESTIHAKVLADPESNIFTGSDFTSKPGPHTIVGSGLNKKQCWEIMFIKYTYLTICGKTKDYITWYKEFENDAYKRTRALPPVSSLYSFIRQNETMQTIINSSATRMNKQTMVQVTNKIGMLDNGVDINDNLLLGVSYKNLFDVFSQGRKSVIEGKLNISNEGKKQNIIQYAMPDLIIGYDYTLRKNNGIIIDPHFIDALPIVYKLPAGSMDRIVAEFANYLAA